MSNYDQTCSERRLVVRVAEIQTEPAPFCPDCDARMVLRRPRPDQTWQPFWGCSQFPDCTASREIGEDSKPVYDELVPELSEMDMIGAGDIE